MIVIHRGICDEQVETLSPGPKILIAVSARVLVQEQLPDVPLDDQDLDVTIHRLIFPRPVDTVEGRSYLPGRTPTYVYYGNLFRALHTERLDC